MTNSYTASLMEQRFRELNARLDSIEAQLDIISAAIAAAAPHARAPDSDAALEKDDD